MGKINIKGGVWRNTEDEILKAAVMKYGKNQWARIASLLHRKSAKQCKARWYEWLDPSVKKTEWSREEDEKLLHLSKLMPTQWRTIAPIVGRTANQCLERYEFLLDKAQNLDGAIKDDVRRLRPGEIDPTPETKPARPDPVDMDEDELEMLSEARARLANTQGKKAKRKARERQLEIARRMALMQKRRELRAAGLGSRANLLSNKNMRVRIWGVDYNGEIPFEKQAPKGFYDTSNEHSELVKRDFDKLKLQDVQKTPYMEKEKLERKKDEERLKKKMENDLPGALIARDKMGNEPSMKRSKLVLPSPQIDDGELENLIKIKKQALVADMSANQSNEVNGGLDVSATPRPAKSVDFRLTNEDDPSIEAPGSIRMASYRGAGGKSERLDSQRSMLRTGDRDSVVGGETPAIQKLKKSQLISSLSQLPAPKNEFEIFMPEEENEEKDAEKMEDDDDESGKSKDIVDQAEIDKQREEKRKAEEEAEWKTRSKAVQRFLPRPIDVNDNILRNTGQMNDLQKAEELIKSEMLRMLHYDALKNPSPQLLNNLQRPNSEGKILGPQGIQKKLSQLSILHENYLKNNNNYEKIDEERMKNAQKLIEDEIEVVKSQIGHGDLSFDAYTKVWNECLSQVLYLPNHHRFTRASIASKKDRIESAEKQLLSYRHLMTEEAKKAAKFEKKLRVLLGGYQSRSQNLIKAFQETVDQLEQTAIEYESLNRLREQESKAINHRLDLLKEDVERQKNREARLQEVYGALIRVKENRVKQSDVSVGPCGNVQMTNISSGFVEKVEKITEFTSQPNIPKDKCDDESIQSNGHSVIEPVMANES